jgi:biotin transport system substrate-specific component
MHQSQSIIEVYRQKRFSFYQWRTQSSVITKMVMAGGLAALTGVLAQVKVYLPWTPVPVVASQLGVILAAVLLGRRWGGVSMTIYALGALAGLPWLAGHQGGLAALAGPTGGYVLGFILAALFMGNLFDTRAESRKVLPLTGAILFAQLVLVYIPGLIHLTLWQYMVMGQEISVSSILWMGYIPFILGDILKSLLGAAVAKTIIPMEKF